MSALESLLGDHPENGVGLGYGTIARWCARDLGVIVGWYTPKWSDLRGKVRRAFPGEKHDGSRIPI
jgi:hypothetical protein